MPIHTGRIRCKCGHAFAFFISEAAPRPPDTRYVVRCPMNDSPYTFRVGDLPTVDEIPPNAIPARRWSPRTGAPQIAAPSRHSRALLAAGVILLALAIVTAAVVHRFVFG